MVELNLPEYNFKVKKTEGGSWTIHDRLRDRWVALTPEEWVRQHFVGWLIADKGFPAALMGNEVSLTQNGIARRCDTVVANLKGQMEVLLSQYYTASTPDEQKAIVMEYSRVDSLLNVHNAKHYREVFENNKKNIIGAYALNGLVQYENMSFEKLDSIMNHSNTAISEFEPLRIARTNLFHVANTSEGKPYVDIAGIDFATGQPTKLSAMLDTSKVTLVDFWASWCGPCRKEISENLIRLYDKYNQQGLNIIGVDVWERDTADHRKAVQELGINYPQLIDMTKKSTEEYGVDGIPTILLLGKDGIILKRNLRGEELETAVVEALGIEQ
jgi:thiol-disulfide isomerase/thioredoxin